MEITKDELEAKHKKEFMFSLWDEVRFFFLVRKIRRAKIASLWEANMDKLFFETTYPSVLSYDDAADRQALIDERKKPLADQNEGKIAQLEDTITKAKAVKQSYRKNEEFREEVKNYISLLDLWINR